MSTKTKLLGILTARRRNQGINQEEMRRELEHLRRHTFASTEAADATLGRCRERIAQLGDECEEIDKMLELVANHCPEEP